jgi:hypothetical protein
MSLAKYMSSFIGSKLGDASCDVWRAPGRIVQRHLFCGRNTNYLSEELSFSGRMGNAIPQFRKFGVARNRVHIEALPRRQPRYGAGWHQRVGSSAWASRGLSEEFRKHRHGEHGNGNRRQRLFCSLLISRYVGKHEMNTVSGIGSLPARGHFIMTRTRGLRG